GHGVLSTLSHLCGNMARTMRSPGLLTLAFFCGLHTAAGATLQGGEGLMRAVTLQLLSAMPGVTLLAGADLSIVARELMAGDLNMICYVFSEALAQFQAGRVLVLIDGAHFNGTEARSAEMRAVVRFLHKTVVELRTAGRGLVLKVLVTNPAGRQRFEWDLPGQDLYM
ncbi:hypothetical protein QBC46DRAFT_254553, partial [Diplogelasinospora grovesii]